MRVTLTTDFPSGTEVHTGISEFGFCDDYTDPIYAIESVLLLVQRGVYKTVLLQQEPKDAE